MEEYYSSDRLLHLDIGSVTQVSSENDDFNYTTIFVGVDYGRSVLTTLPSKRYLSEGVDYDEIFQEGRLFEMRTIHDGLIVAFESSVVGIYSGRLLVSSFPEMIEARRLRSGARFPCVISCDMHCRGLKSYGVITNISRGGCQIVVDNDHDEDFVKEALKKGETLTLEVFFPPSDQAQTIKVEVKSTECKLDSDCKIGVAYAEEYESVERYLESLQLDSVAPFFR